MFTSPKILPSLKTNKEEDERKSGEVIVEQTNNITNLQSSQHNQDQQSNDMPAPTLTESVDPYSLPFTRKSSLTLIIKDELCPCYVEGYNLLHDSRTSK